jgi:hypothetical protein
MAIDRVAVKRGLATSGGEEIAETFLCQLPANREKYWSLNTPTMELMQFSNNTFM